MSVTRPMTPEEGLTAFKSVQDQAKRYLEAVYGDAVWFRAPETFENLTERWIWAVASGSPEIAEQSMTHIEELAAESRGDTETQMRARHRREAMT